MQLSSAAGQLGLSRPVPPPDARVRRGAARARARQVGCELAWEEISFGDLRRPAALGPSPPPDILGGFNSSFRCTPLPLEPLDRSRAPAVFLFPQSSLASPRPARPAPCCAEPSAAARGTGCARTSAWQTTRSLRSMGSPLVRRPRARPPESAPRLRSRPRARPRAAGRARAHDRGLGAQTREGARRARRRTGTTRRRGPADPRRARCDARGALTAGGAGHAGALLHAVRRGAGRGGRLRLTAPTAPRNVCA